MEYWTKELITETYRILSTRNKGIVCNIKQVYRMLNVYNMILFARLKNKTAYKKTIKNIINERL